MKEVDTALGGGGGSGTTTDADIMQDSVQPVLDAGLHALVETDHVVLEEGKKGREGDGEKGAE